MQSTHTLVLARKSNISSKLEPVNFYMNEWANVERKQGKIKKNEKKRQAKKKRMNRKRDRDEESESQQDIYHFN